MSQHNNLIYLDYAATTPVARPVATKMGEYLTVDGVFGNPASRSHGYGWQAEEKIEYAGEEIELKGKPFEVLTHLARHRDQIVSKEQLLDAIWEEPELVTPNVIEVAINQIRQKMDKPLNISTIETIRRRGYRFCYPNQVDEK